MTRRYAAWSALLVGFAVLVFAPALTAPSAAASRAAAVAGQAQAGAAYPLSVAAWGAPALATADVMPDFAAGFVLDRDGGVQVTETIRYSFDPAAGSRHGIYRSLTVRQGIEGQEEAYRYFSLGDVSVSSPTGANTDVEIVDNGAVRTIKIGSAKTTVSGTQTYVVSYHLANVMNAFPDSQTAEFYYNVFKSDAIAKSLVTLTLTGPTPATEVRCGRGAQASECEAATAGPPAQFVVANLRSYENLTIAAKYPLGAFATIAPDIRSGGSVLAAGPARALSYAMLGAGVLLPLLAAVGMSALFLRKGRDEWYVGLTPGLSPSSRRPEPSDSGPSDSGGSQTGQPAAVPGLAAPATRRGGRPTVAVQFNPPPGVQPGLVGTIIDESADTLDVSATVIDLAVRGFLVIEEVKSEGRFSRTDWRLTRLEPRRGETLRPYESTLLEGLFERGDPVLLSELKNHFASTLGKVKSQMYTEVLDRGWFRKSPQTQRALWSGLGFLLIGAGLVATFALGALAAGLTQTAGLSWPVSPGVVAGLGLLVTGVIVLLVGRRMAAKTAEGSAVLAQALGFRQYLVTAEANQIKWEEAQEIFSRFLPFAIVFGVADRWARTFQEVAAAAAAAGQVVVMPNWYIYHGSVFPDFTSITDGVDNFSTTASGTFTSTPGSSGGSGFGSSGGSFSGGGVGGSSSGSW